MNISLSTRQAYAEIDEFLELLNEEQRNEIPKKIREIFKEEKEKEYNKKINPNISIKYQNLKEETLAIIALLNLQYWCKDEEEKKRLKIVYEQNEEKYQDLLYERYNPNHIFRKNDENNIYKEESMRMIEYKESIFKRIINKVLKFLHLR